MTAASRTLVVGLGHEDRGDDAAGPLAVRLLARAWADRPPSDVALRVWRGDALGLIDAWAGAERLVLVDAVASADPPGTWRRYDADAPFATDPGASSHGFGLAAALALARALGRLPPTVEVWGVAGAAFDRGTAPSAGVVAAAAGLAAHLAATLGPPSRASEDVPPS